MDRKEIISTVVPCYNEREVLPVFYDAVKKVAQEREDWEFEFMFVSDGSKDGTDQYLRKIAAEDKRVRYVSFSRNFGKEAAMFAGLRYSSGDYVAIMDADLQDPPEMLLQMYETIKKEECDSVAACRADRKGEPPVRSLFSKAFYRIMRHISDTDIVDGARDFRLMTRRMADSILEMKEYNRFTKGIFGWVGFETKWISYENRERVAGKTKWSFQRLFQYSLDGIVNFSTVPLHISSFAGIFMCLIAFVFVAVVVLRRLIFGDPVAGWASLISVMLFIGGIQMFCIGILGKYLACTYMETKRRPLYIIKDSNCMLERTAKDAKKNESDKG